MSAHASFFITCDKMPRLLRNWHLVTTSRSADIAIRKKERNTTRLKCCACHAKWDQRCPKCCACHENTTHLLKMWQRYCACHTKRILTRPETCWNARKCHACHAKWSYATLESSKSEPFCRTSYRHGHTALTRTVATAANGCERKRNVRRTQLYPHTPRVKREPLPRLGTSWVWSMMVSSIGFAMLYWVELCLQSFVFSWNPRKWILDFPRIQGVYARKQTHLFTPKTYPLVI